MHGKQFGPNPQEMNKTDVTFIQVENTSKFAQSTNYRGMISQVIASYAVFSVTTQIRYFNNNQLYGKQP